MEAITKANTTNQPWFAKYNEVPGAITPTISPLPWIVVHGSTPDHLKLEKSGNTACATTIPTPATPTFTAKVQPSALWSILSVWAKARSEERRVGKECRWRWARSD